MFAHNTYVFSFVRKISLKADNILGHSDLLSNGIPAPQSGLCLTFDLKILDRANPFEKV